eukprot:TRINITY_DN295_c0_g1_i2.p1 TRINITY_DN295_c0_g1~~TRINITY_DN295_c0_g1_i2.p1  ORF type:complete len:267 (+),score=84.24 TRINITY_DN295_c0_g1_i2:107-802(+)
MDEDNRKEMTIDEKDLELAETEGGEKEKENETDLVVPKFPALTPAQMNGGKQEERKIVVPKHRFTPLKENWTKIFTPIVNNMKLQIRMNTKNRTVELRTSEFTDDIGALQKAADFVQAFMLGFDVEDALALLRLEDLYVDSFEIDDVRRLHGDHLSRAIGRVAGKDGKTKFAIENATRTRIVLADRKIHLLGSFNNIQVARESIVSLILGAPPGKVTAKLRTVAARLTERY